MDGYGVIFSEHERNCQEEFDLYWKDMQSVMARKREFIQEFEVSCENAKREAETQKKAANDSYETECQNRTEELEAERAKGTEADSHGVFSNS